MVPRVGFLGAGFIARFHRGMLDDAETLHELVAVYDPDLDKAEEFVDGTGAAVAASVDDVLATSDAVFVCAWTAAHEPLVAAAVDRGCAVFCEKPLAFDLAAARRMVDAVEAAGVVNQVGLVLRSLPSFRFLRYLLDHPDNGHPMAVVFRDDQFLPIQGHYDSTWRADPALAGAGTLLEHSIHDLDILDWLLGDVARIAARSASFHAIDGIEDVVVATLEFQSGALATLTSVWHDVLTRPSLRRLEIFCERAYFALEGDFSGPVRWDRGDGDQGSLGGVELADAAAAVGAGWDNPADRFLRSVVEGTAAWPDFRSALRAHALVDAAYESAEHGGVPRKPEGPLP